MKTILEQFDVIAEFEDMLDEAQSNAETSWEINFVDDIADKYDDYGVSMYFSDSQRDKMFRIANG